MDNNSTMWPIFTRMSAVPDKGTIISREVIMKTLWDRDSFIDDNTLTVNVTRLSDKLEELGLSDFIITKKELGYMVVE